jgi:hypothetical protein
VGHNAQPETGCAPDAKQPHRLCQPTCSRPLSGRSAGVRNDAFPSAAQHLPPDAIEQLASVHPDLELTLLHFEPPDGLAQLAGGEVAAGVTHRYPGACGQV